MISKAKLKDLTAYRLQKSCDKEAVFVVEGPKMAAEAIASGFAIRTVCATREWQGECGEGKAAECYEVTDAELERLSNFKSPNQVWMLVERPSAYSKLDIQRSKFILALDHLQDPGNLGTIMRTADWFGVRTLVCSPDTVSCFNPKVVQASMGAVFRTEVLYTDLPAWLAACHKPVYGASLQGKPISAVDSPNDEAVLVIGNESVGISPEVMKQVTHPVLIPNIGGTAESLNAAVAAGVLMGWFSKIL